MSAGQPKSVVINIYLREGHRRDQREEVFLAAVANTLAGIIVRKQTEWALHEREEQLRQQDRLAAVGQLAAGIAHDFNNLLTSMMGTAEVLCFGEKLSEPVKEEMGVILSEGRRAAQLVRQILDFSRKTVVQRQPVDLAPFLKEGVSMLTRILPESIRVVTEVEGSGHIAEGNATQFQQVLTNLSVNARDAMPAGGALRIGLSHLRLDGEGQPPVVGMVPGDRIAREMRQADPMIATVLVMGSGLEEDDPRLAAFDLQIQKPASMEKVEGVIAQAIELHDARAEGKCEAGLERKEGD